MVSTASVTTSFPRCAFHQPFDGLLQVLRRRSTSPSTMCPRHAADSARSANSSASPHGRYGLRDQQRGDAVRSGQQLQCAAVGSPGGKIPSSISPSTELRRCWNAELFNVMSTSLPSRPSPIVAMRYSSGVCMANRT